MLSERRKLIEDIGVARAAGARLAPACESAGICLRTYRRWTREDAVAADRRGQAVRLTPAHPLSEAERAELLRVCSEPRFASLPPSQIVPRLADEGVYLASESSFYRVLHAASQQQHRGRADAPRRKPLTSHEATGPNPSVVLGHHVSAERYTGPVLLPVSDSGPVQPQDRRLGSAGHGIR